jgi:hypothetical protein
VVEESPSERRGGGGEVEGQGTWKQKAMWGRFRKGTFFNSKFFERW